MLEASFFFFFFFKENKHLENECASVRGSCFVFVFYIKKKTHRSNRIRIESAIVRGRGLHRL